MYCKYCGRLNDEDAMFCQECGTPFNQEEQENKNEDEKNQQQPKQKTKTNNKTKHKTKNKTKNKTKTKKQKPRKQKYKNTEKGMTFGQKILMFLMFIMIIGLAGIIALAGYKYYKMEQIKVPNLINMTYEQAELTLAKKDLKIKKVEEKTSDQTKDNIVLKQNKTSGQKVRKNTTIKVYVGKYEQKYIVEDFTGQNINDVMNTLDINNIKYEIKYKETNDYENYTIIEQTPKKGKTITQNDEIILTVAKNKEIQNQNNNQSDTQDNQNKQEPSQSEENNNNTNGSRISGGE